MSKNEKLDFYWVDTENGKKSYISIWAKSDIREFMLFQIFYEDCGFGCEIEIMKAEELISDLRKWHKMSQELQDLSSKFLVQTRKALNA